MAVPITPSSQNELTKLSVVLSVFKLSTRVIVVEKVPKANFVISPEYVKLNVFSPFAGTVKVPVGVLETVKEFVPSVISGIALIFTLVISVPVGFFTVNITVLSAFVKSPSSFNLLHEYKPELTFHFHKFI